MSADNVLSVDMVDYNLLELAATRLISLLEEECRLLSSNKIEATRLLQAEKNDLVNFLDLHKTYFQSDCSNKKAIPEEKKLVLKELFAKLTEVAQQNVHEVLRKQYANDHILKLISQSVNDEKNKFVGYDMKGKKRINKRPVAKTPHVSLNQEI